jgi:hypothetical protein
MEPIKLMKNLITDFLLRKRTNLKISIEELQGGTSCPHCANPIALATCSCGGIHCLGAKDTTDAHGAVHQIIMVFQRRI